MQIQLLELTFDDLCDEKQTQCKSIHSIWFFSASDRPHFCLSDCNLLKIGMTVFFNNVQRKIVQGASWVGICCGKRAIDCCMARLWSCQLLQEQNQDKTLLGHAVFILRRKSLLQSQVTTYNCSLCKSTVLNSPRSPEKL